VKDLARILRIAARVLSEIPVINVLDLSAAQRIAAELVWSKEIPVMLAAVRNPP